MWKDTPGVVTKHQAGRAGRRVRARVPERERTHDAHDNKLVAETGNRSFSPVAEGAPRSVVGSRQEIAQQATTIHAKTRRVGFAGRNEGSRCKVDTIQFPPSSYPTSKGAGWSRSKVLWIA